MVCGSRNIDRTITNQAQAKAYNEFRTHPQQPELQQLPLLLPLLPQRRQHGPRLPPKERGCVFLGGGCLLVWFVYAQLAHSSWSKYAERERAEPSFPNHIPPQTKQNAPSTLRHAPLSRSSSPRPTAPSTACCSSGRASDGREEGPGRLLPAAGGGGGWAVGGVVDERWETRARSPSRWEKALWVVGTLGVDGQMDGSRDGKKAPTAARGDLPNS